jgi:hypothetical protein
MLEAPPGGITRRRGRRRSTVRIGALERRRDGPEIQRRRPRLAGRRGRDRRAARQVRVRRRRLRELRRRPDRRCRYMVRRVARLRRRGGRGVVRCGVRCCRWGRAGAGLRCGRVRVRGG